MCFVLFACVWSPLPREFVVPSARREELWLKVPTNGMVQPHTHMYNIYIYIYIHISHVFSQLAGASLPLFGGNPRGDRP